MSYGCRNQFEMSKTFVCACADDKLKPHSVDLEKEFFQCLGVKFEEKLQKRNHHDIVFVCQIDHECEWQMNFVLFNVLFILIKMHCSTLSWITHENWIHFVVHTHNTNINSIALYLK